MICDRCNKPNTEFSHFVIEVDLEQVKDRVQFSGSSWLKRVVTRYVNRLLGTHITRKVSICQSCQSKMFRNLDKDL